MMSLEAIQHESRKAALRAARNRLEPLMIEPEDVGIVSVLYGIPFLGDYIPKSWRRTDRDELFVDTSGFGVDGEPALSARAFALAIRPGYGYAVVEAGQFQAYVAEYERCPDNGGA